MIDTELVLVDTNVIIDVTGEDPDWQEWSFRQMSLFPDNLIINPIIYGELCYPASGIEEVDTIISILGLGYHELPKDALFIAAQAYRRYRRQGGLKTAPLADFFIGAHAEVIGVSILTRDISRYRTYFPAVRLIHP